MSYSTERYITHAFEQLGYGVHTIQEDSFVTRDYKAIAKEIQVLDPLFVIFSKGKLYGESVQLIDELRKCKIKTCAWLFDLFFDLPSDRKWRLEKKEAPFNSDIVFSTDGGHNSEFERIGIKHSLLRQGIHEPEAVMVPFTNYKHDVIFVGSDVYRTRVMLLAGLDEHYGKGFARYGGQGSTVRGMPLNELYAQTKIVVGDSQPSPKYWSNRIYETLGRGGFLIHPMVEGLDKEFVPYKHFIPYDYGDYDQLYEIIDYYLSHDKEREEIRKAGHEYCKKHYTYTKRAEELIKVICSQ